MKRTKQSRILSNFPLFPSLKEWNFSIKVSKLQDGACNSDALDALPEPPIDLDCSLDRKGIESRWLKEVEKLGEEGASLSQVILTTLVPDLIFQIILYIVSRLASVFVLFEATNYLLIYLVEYDLERVDHLKEGTPVRNQQARDLIEQALPNRTLALFGLGDIDLIIFQYLCTISLSSTIRKMSFSWLAYGGVRIGLKCRVILTMLIQMKSLKLNLYGSETRSSSKAIELLTNEVTFIEEASRYITCAFSGPISLVCCLVWLALRVVDWRASLATLPLIIAFLILKYYLLKIRNRANANRTLETNKRIEATGSFLDSIKVIKMYAWERPFRDQIQAFRNSELDYTKTLDLLTVLDLAIFIASSILLPSLCLLVAIYYQTEFTIQSLFLVPLCFQSLSSDYILHLSIGFQSLGELVSGCANIKDYLLLDERNDQRQFDITHDDKQEQPNKHIVVCDDLCVSNAPTNRYLSGKITNRRPSCIGAMASETTGLIVKSFGAKLKSNELVAIVGRVGSGKSTLLRALLGEACVMAGIVRLKRGTTISYASQEPWILSDSFKVNILLGRPFHVDRYKAVIEACSLQQDIEKLAEGEDTRIGPRGVSLSGGQKARLNLARAVYTEADVYLLDDPLSAVDARVAQHIVNKCIKQLLRDKLVLLATHQLQFLNQADKIIYLDPVQKTTVEVGSVEEILAKDDIRNFVSSKNFESCKLDSLKLAAKDDPNESVSGKTEKALNQIRVTTVAIQNSNLVKKKESSLCIFFLKLGFGLLSFGFLILNASLSGPLITYVTYYYRVWSEEAFKDMHNPNLDQTEFYKHLFQSWSTQTIIVVLALAHLLIYALHLARGIRNCSRKLHNKLITSLFHAKMSFYDFCCAGEFTSRYAASFALIDHLLLYSAVYFISFFIWMLGGCIMLGFINLYSFLHLVGFYLILSHLTRHYFEKLDTLTSLSRSLLAPVLTNLMDLVEDLCTIRSNKSYLDHLEHKFNASQNKFTSMALLKLSFETRVFVGIKFISGIAFFALRVVLFSVFRTEMDVSTAGCVLLILQSITTLLPVTDDYRSIMQTAMGGVEKVRQYTELEAEEGFSPLPKINETNKSVKTISWSRGSIEFSDVTLRYSANDRPVLDGLSFSLIGGEHVGVVGRTGAGKSSMLSVLFRLYTYDGVISIDESDISSIPLSELRSSLGVIPQDPVLFHDTLRNNLDPFGEYLDEQIWHALKVVNLSNHVAKDLISGLNHQITERGRNFSVGQRQLVCLARAILKAPKILLIDEATANVDLETDALIQLLIRKQFVNSTVITIAHRLQTVLDYDRIMVLDNGRIAEFDTVERLTSSEGGLLSQMLKASSVKY